MAIWKMYPFSLFLMSSVCFVFEGTAAFDTDAIYTPNAQDGNFFNLALGGRHIRETHDNSCVPVVKDNLTYYDMTITTGAIDEWIEIDEDKQLSPVDKFYPRVNLPWSFPFYGHDINHIFPSTLGMMSMSEGPEKRPTHFVAPLFVHFKNYTSAAYFHSTDDIFIVEWRDLFIRDDTEWGPIQFQVIANRNGTIMFLYKRLPTGAVDESFMIGMQGGISLHISGPPGVRAVVAYLPSSVRTTDVFEGTMVRFSPKSYCDLSDDAQLCEADDISFYCHHCHMGKHCSFHEDRAVQEWLMARCSNKVPKKCRHNDGNEKGGISITFILTASVVVATLILSMVTGCWCYYAYSHPTTPSGLWLIEHRPSQWKSMILNRNKASKDDENKSQTTEEIEADPIDGDV